MPELTIRIECGKKTCAKEPGKFCKFFGTKKFGSIPTCCLFPSEDQIYTELEVVNDWTVRCQACLDAEERDLFSSSKGLSCSCGSSDLTEIPSGLDSRAYECGNCNGTVLIQFIKPQQD